MSPEGGSPEARAGIARWYGYVEDVVYVGLGLLLACIVIVLLLSSFVAFARTAWAWRLASGVGELLDEILLLLLLVELLYTVQVSFREHTLVAEPFLLVGLISVIRRVLVLTATLGEHYPGETQAAQETLVSELAVMAALILSLAIALVLLRKREPAPKRAG